MHVWFANPIIVAYYAKDAAHNHLCAKFYSCTLSAFCCARVDAEEQEKEKEENDEEEETGVPSCILSTTVLNNIIGTYPAVKMFTVCF